MLVLWLVLGVGEWGWQWGWSGSLGNERKHVMAKSSIAVPSSFDDQLEALITRIKSEGWDKKFSLDVKTLDVDLKGQRSEKQKDVKLLQDYEAFHRLFTVAQGERYGRYMQALEILRAAHRTQPDVLKSLEPFKRQSTPRKKPAAK